MYERGAIVTITELTLIFATNAFSVYGGHVTRATNRRSVFCTIYRMQANETIVNRQNLISLPRKHYKERICGVFCAVNSVLHIYI